MSENQAFPGATIDRGIIKSEESGGFVVASYTREGVETRPLKAVNAYVREYEGDPPTEHKYTYAVGDEVYFFMFDDGRGMILGKMER